MVAGRTAELFVNLAGKKLVCLSPILGAGGQGGAGGEASFKCVCLSSDCSDNSGGGGGLD